MKLISNLWIILIIFLLPFWIIELLNIDLSILELMKIEGMNNEKDKTS